MVGCRLVEEDEGYAEPLFELLHVGEEAFTVYRIVLTEELPTIEGEGAEEAGAMVGARCQYQWRASPLGPHVTGDRVVEEDGLVLA